MDRGKSGQGKRPNKAKGSLPPGDLFALGSKPTKPGESSFQKSSSSGSSIAEKKLSALGDRKREPTSLLAPGGVKKPKILAPGQTFTPLGRPGDRDTDKRLSPVPPVSLAFEESSIEVDSAILLTEILAAEDSNDFDRLEGLLCGAVKYLHGNRSKPDHIMYLTLMHLAKAKPSVYNSELVIEAFCTLLKRDMSLNFKSKGNSLVSVMACNVLMRAYSDEDNWPDDFVKVYIDDALGERVWVDRPDCKGFVDNIVTAFNTSIPKGGLSSVEVKTEPGSASPVVSIGEDDDIKMEVDSDKSSSSTPELQNVTVYPRYPYQIDNIETLVLEIIHEQLVKRQLMDASSKSLIKLMTATCGYGEVRLIAAQKLELWLQNPKLARASQELLMSVCMNCSEHDAGDMEVIAMLIKMRMKTKPLINHYLVCIRELLVQHTDNLRMVLTHTIYNELSTTRNPNNMALIGVVFTTTPDTAATILAEIFQDLLTNKDDYVRALRALLREIVRSLRYDINFTSFCLAIMQERTEPKFTDMEQAFKERYVLAVTDLVSMCVLQAITPAVREAVAALNRGDKKDVDIIYNYQNLVATIQRDAIWWLHTIVPKFFEQKQQEYVFCMRKVLFMESGEQYAKDNWPAEADRSAMIRLATECPVLQDTLMRVLVIGLSRELSLTPQDAVEFVDILVKRAANLNVQGGRQVLLVERLELFDALLNLCTYRHPENIALPAGYTPPQLAISNLYWKAWTILLVISAYNPTSFGLAAWENYPTLKCMIEMVMTNNYKFPPPTTAVDDSVIEEIRSKEIQVAQKEKQEILEFEGYLAASTTKVTITEANSLLIAQLTTMEPNGAARKPPQQTMDQLRSINDSLRIGQMLCRSRSPDFLLDIIQRQGTSQSMPWLAELVESSEGSLDVLPVQCLCEFLLHETQDVVKDGQDDESIKFEKHKKKQKMKKQQQLLSRLQTLVHDSNADSSTTHEVMDYFLKRLASTQAANRALATKGMSMIISRSQLSPTEEGPVSMETDVHHQHNWLLVNFPALPMFPQVKGKTCSALRQAIQIEADPSLVSAYIMFLSRHTTDHSLQELDELALDIAQLIVERTTILNYILPQDTGMSTTFSGDTLEAFIQLFVNYIRKAKEPNTAGYSWSNTQDQIILQWESGESATMHILVVHAMIILLSYGPSQSENLYKELLETWFPEKSKPPSAFLLDTSEEALLLPDWLKLRMIRSSAEPLIDAALQDLEPSQLLLFVQSFGIPVHSMSKLLQCLDNAVTMDVVSLEQSVLDKAYMAQLIEVQHKRGAQGGDKFYSMLTDGKTLEKNNDDEKMDTQSADDSMWKGQGHIDVIMETIPASHVANMILQAFDPSGRRSPDTETHFRSLVMSVNKRSSGALDVIKGFNDILQGSSGAEFAKSVIQSTKACSLLRIIMAKQNEAGVKSSLYQAMEMLGRHCVGQKSPMTVMVHQYLVSQTKQQPQRPQLRSEKQEQFLEDLTTLAASDSSQLESLVRESMRSTMKADGIISTTQMACSVLLRDQTQSISGTMLPSTCALFVDWLELLDPEVIRMVPDLQEKLLFAKQSVTQSSQRREHSSQPYLLALLTHQSSWSTLNRCINSLLSSCDKGYDPVSVLDFLWACTHVPKIWQGRERKLPKNQSPEDVLCLTGSQLVILVSYIIQEATSQSHDSESTNEIPLTMRNRIELLKACVCGNQDKVKDLVLYVERMLKLKSSNTHLYEAFLLELYLQYPFLSAWLSDSRCVTSEALASHNSQTQMDLITHRLITGLYQGSRSKRNDNRMADVNIACRKLAAEHPVLVLRQLPALVALLKGKTQFTFAEFKQRNLLMLYINILGILELLQPSIFYREHSTLNSILEEYFSLLTAYSCNTNKQMAPLIVKLVKMLNDYVNHDCQRANSLLQKHVLLLTNVSSQFPDLSPLKSLLAGLTLPRHSQEDVEGSAVETGSVAYPLRPSSPWAASHLAPFLQKIKKDNSDEVLMVLQDLDESSKRKVEILEHFVDDLKRLMLTHNDQSRNTAFELAKRHIKQNPKKAVDFVPAFLHCLESENPDIITSALTNLAEFTLLCQDYADVILQKALSAGINTSIETSSYISESLQLLNLDLASV